MAEFISTRNRLGGRGYVCKLCHSRNMHKSRLYYTYGVTLAAFNEMVQKQGGGCAICGLNERVSYKGVASRLCVDHDHRTGRFRGVLCRRCNAAIGLMQDSADYLSKAALYLKSNGE